MNHSLQIEWQSMLFRFAGLLNFALRMCLSTQFAKKNGEQ